MGVGAINLDERQHSVARRSRVLLKPRLGQCRSAAHEERNMIWDCVELCARDASECIMAHLQVTMCTFRWVKDTALPGTASLSMWKSEPLKPPVSCGSFFDVIFVAHSRPHNPSRTNP